MLAAIKHAVAYMRASAQLMRAARIQAGSAYNQHRHEIKWQVRLRAGSIARGVCKRYQKHMMLLDVQRIIGA